MIYLIEQIVTYRLLKVRAGSQVSSCKINCKSENYSRVSTVQLSPITLCLSNFMCFTALLFLCSYLSFNSGLFDFSSQPYCVLKLSMVNEIIAIIKNKQDKE